MPCDEGDHGTGPIWKTSQTSCQTRDRDMHTICTSRGTIEIVEDQQGQPAKNPWPRPVDVRLRYQLKPSPRQPLSVEITGRHLFSLGGIEKLTLENGLTLTGRTYVVGKLDPNQICRQRMTDVQETGIRLFPDKSDEISPEIDSFVFGMVSTEPLAEGLCITPGWTPRGRPFQFVEGPRSDERSRKKMTWCGRSTLRIHYGDFEITFARTSGYWKKLVDLRPLRHSVIVGLRKASYGETVTWAEFNEIVELLESFVGWVNHCVSPVFHIKGYRNGRLAYRGYELHPYATAPRDRFSWLPKYGPDETSAVHGDMVSHAFTVLSDAWAANRASRGGLHIALQMLRSKEKGGPGSSPSILYLRDAFGAISILTSILVGPNPSGGRHQTMINCLGHLEVPDEIPDPEGRRYLSKNHQELWSARNGVVRESERRKGTLARPLANVQNWLLHLDDPSNSARLLELGSPRQSYFVEVTTWLADLMSMRAVGYEGTYFNRLTGSVEAVPWIAECQWSR